MKNAAEWTKKGSTWAIEFDTMEDYWRVATQVESGAGEKMAGRDSRKADNDWTGTKTFAQAEQFARFGWEEGTRNIGKLAARIADRIGRETRVERMVLDVVGETPEVATYLSGEPENMVRFEDEVQKSCGKIVRISVNCVTSGSVKAATIFRRGAVIVALVDAIERAGHLAEITFRADSRHGGGKTVAIAAVAKRAGEPMNIARCAFILGHPAMDRRMTFSVSETCPDARDLGFYYDGGFGNPMSTPKQFQGEIHFDQMEGGESAWQTEESAEKFALNELRKLGLLDERDVETYAGGL